MQLSVTKAITPHTLLQQDILLACTLIESVLQLRGLNLKKATYFFTVDMNDRLNLNLAINMVGM
jgi:hypothetical protein